MSDSLIRANTGGVPAPHFEKPAFTEPPPIQQARVALVTTAGLQRPGDPIWKAGEQSFRSFNKDERELTISHLSNNFDRSGLVADLNVAFPLERLEEMAAQGRIGSVAQQHLSFMGALDETMETLRLDTAPEAASLLLADGVQVALLTPV